MIYDIRSNAALRHARATCDGQEMKRCVAVDIEAGVAEVYELDSRGFPYLNHDGTVARAFRKGNIQLIDTRTGKRWGEEWVEPMYEAPRKHYLSRWTRFWIWCDRVTGGAEMGALFGAYLRSRKSKEA